MKILKNILKKEWAQNFLALVASQYVKFVYKTSKWTHIGFEIPQKYLEDNKPFITCFWHAKLLLLPYAWPFKDHPFSMLISGHKDGRLISKTVSYFGIDTIHGSTKHQGTEALLSMIHHSKRGITVGITPDGPRGPAYKVTVGTVAAAYLAKADVVPVTYYTSRHKLFKTWDRFFFPLPFSKGVFLWGEPTPYPVGKNTFDKCLLEIEKKLKDAEQEAWNALNK